MTLTKKQAKEVWEKVFPFKVGDYVKFKGDKLKQTYYGTIVQELPDGPIFEFYGFTSDIQGDEFLPRRGKEKAFRIVLAPYSGDMTADIPEHYLRRAKRCKPKGQRKK